MESVRAHFPEMQFSFNLGNPQSSPALFSQTLASSFGGSSKWGDEMEIAGHNPSEGFPVFSSSGNFLLQGVPSVHFRVWPLFSPCLWSAFLAFLTAHSQT